MSNPRTTTSSRLALPVFLALVGWAPTEAEASSYECDDRYDDCGSPQQSGGGGGGGGGSVLVNNTDLGDTYQYADDYDDDGIEDPHDNCPWDENPDQADADGDLVGSACDNCPADFNEFQDDLDGDLVGDTCDDDLDGDGVLNADDLCAEVNDPLQNDTDGDGLGDACDDDMDDDGVPNVEDNCPLVANPDQANDDPDAWGDLCDDDDDADGVRNTWDNCVSVANDSQDDSDGDGLGDACDADLDGDGVVNLTDNCSQTFNPDQLDEDRDTLGDSCDDRYCYVVDGHVLDCLDPTKPLDLFSPPEETKTGEPYRVRLFANRTNQPMRYAWTVVEAPDGSSATVDNPTGAVSISTPFEYHYLADHVAELVPDLPGTYELHVVAELVWPDEVTGQQGVTAETWTTLEVTGEPVASTGCSTVGAGAAALFPLVGLFGLARRRRDDEHA